MSISYCLINSSQLDIITYIDNILLFYSTQITHNNIVIMRILLYMHLYSPYISIKIELYEYNPSIINMISFKVLYF